MAALQCRGGTSVVSDEASGLVEKRIELLEDIVIQLTGALVSVRLAINIVALQPGLLTRMDSQQEVQKELKDSGERVNNILNLLNEMILRQKGAK
jgi:septal ring factor EnvC (AmiA/AmiB activator)